MPSRVTGAKPALRPVNRADSDFLYRLYAGSRAAEMAMVDWSETQKREFLQMQLDAQSRYYTENYADARFDIIELGGEPIGRLYVDDRKGELRVIDIALLAEYQGRGIGGCFMQAIIDRAFAEHAFVSIHVEHDNPAMKLYQRLGFRKVRDVGVYWYMECRVGGDQENTAS